MDFVQWCDQVLDCAIAEWRTNETARLIGINDLALVAIANCLSQNSATDVSRYREPVLEALYALGMADFLSRDPNPGKITPTALDHARDKTNYWARICGVELEGDQNQLLRAANEASQQIGPDWARVQRVDSNALMPDLGWQDENAKTRLYAIARELEQLGFLSCIFTAGAVWMTATYQGLVWQTRRDITLESSFLDNLVKEWETTNVEFKRELGLDTNDQKIEFVKDLLGLANTKASGKRWLIIGFDNKTQRYAAPPDPRLTQNRIEQIIADYIEPYLDVRYSVVDYRLGKVGKIEVLREAHKLPYHVTKALKGDKKQMTHGQIFVRHGSQTEPPTPAELQALQEEGDQARKT